MNKRLYLIVIFFLALAIQTFAQPTEMVWGENLKTRGDIHVIGDIDGYIYAVRYSNKGYEFLDVYDLNTMNLVSTNRMNMRFKKSKNKLSVVTSKIIGKKIVLFAENPSYRDKKNVLYALVMNTEGDVLQDWKQVVEIKSKKNRGVGEFILKTSPDQKKILIFGNYPYQKNELEAYKVVLIDTELNILGDKEMVLPYKDSQTEINNMVVDNNGVVYVSARVELAKRKEKRAARKAKQDIAKMVVISYDFEVDEVIDYEFQLQDKTVLASALVMDTSGKVIVTGFYQDNTNRKGGVSGTFYSKFSGRDLDNEVLTTQAFSTKFVSRIVGSRRAKKGVEINTFYRLREVIPAEDGGLVLIAEEYYVVENCTVDAKTGATRCYYTYHYNDLIVIGTNNSGEIVWENLVHKISSDGSDGYYLSYGVYVEKTKINIVFMDNAKNYNNGSRVKDERVRPLYIKRSVASVATISLNGEIEYNVLYDAKKSKIYMRPRESQQVANKYLFVTGNYKGKRMRIGRVNF